VSPFRAIVNPYVASRSSSAKATNLVFECRSIS